MTDIEQVKAALEEMARQKLSSEFTAAEKDRADFVGGYDEFVTKSRQALAALAHIEQAGGWQPITSAPKDGTKILLGKIVGHPDHPTALWWATSGYWSAKWHNWHNGTEPTGLAGPTHWALLPSKPRAKEQP